MNEGFKLRVMHLSEIVLALSGVLILASLVMISSGGDFSVWVVAKILYLIGVIVFIFSA
jgi:uncharacterized membrane protein SirB2